LDWQWVAQSNSTDAGCPGARRFAFVAGFAPPYAPCVAPPAPEEAEGEGRSWRDWFGFGDRDRDEAPEQEDAPEAPDVPERP
jgi:penicillin-binding protein 1B